VHHSRRVSPPAFSSPIKYYFMLQQVAHYNDLSPKFREELEAKILSFGKSVRYQFKISNINPDPEKYNGQIIWPQMWTLDPITFRVVDPYENRPGVSKSKLIGMVKDVNEKGIPTSFNRVRVHRRHEGKLKFDLESPDDQAYVMYLELHPKLIEGQFLDKGTKQVVLRIDEKKEAIENRERRDKKRLAGNAARAMKPQEIKDFAAAMQWDENLEIDVLRDKVEDLADQTPDLFNDAIANNGVEYKSNIKRALDRGIIAFNPAEHKFLWVANQQVITSLEAGLDGKNEIERFAEWCMTNGTKGDQAYKKIKDLVKV